MRVHNKENARNGIPHQSFKVNLTPDVPFLIKNLSNS